jgi:hypothetical protein
MPVVGVLTVDLVANTTQFSGDMGQAAASAEQFGASAAQAGQAVDFSMRESRGSMMLMSEELGVHIPRHLQALIAQIPGVGVAFAEMLPIVGVIAAIAIISKLIEKTAEAKEKMSQGWDNFGVVSQNVFNALGDKILEVGKKADDLAGRHLEALHKELLLIDHASLHELAEEFGKLEKAGQTLMVEMKSSWYEIRMGSQGASNALTRFTGEYDLLLAKGDKKGAFDKLQGTLNSANAELARMVAQENTMYAPSQKLVDSQRLLVSILEDQLRVTKDVATINAGEKGNAGVEDAQREARSLDERNEAVKEFCDKALKAEQEYQKERAKRQQKGAELAIEMTRYEAKGVEQAWKEHLKVEEELGKQETKQAIVMAKLQEQADEESARHKLAVMKATAAQTVAAEIQASQARLKVETDALDKQHAQLEAAENKDLLAIRTNEDKKTELTRQATNERTKIIDAALQKQYQDTARIENQIAGQISKTLTTSILQAKNLGTAFKKMGAEMVESMMETAMKAVLLNKQGQLSDAEAAATAAYKSGMKAYPSPENMIIAPIQGAAAFAGAMAFEQGGEIPGSGAVPIIGHGGETVVTKALTDQVKNNGGAGGGDQHFHYAPSVQAIDRDGVDEMLKQHEHVFAARMTAILRKNHKRG